MASDAVTIEMIKAATALVTVSSPSPRYAIENFPKAYEAINKAIRDAEIQERMNT